MAANPLVWFFTNLVRGARNRALGPDYDRNQARQDAADARSEEAAQREADRYQHDVTVDEPLADEQRRQTLKATEEARTRQLLEGETQRFIEESRAGLSSGEVFPPDKFEPNIPEDLAGTVNRENFKAQIRHKAEAQLQKEAKDEATLNRQDATSARQERASDRAASAAERSAASTEETNKGKAIENYRKGLASVTAQHKDRVSELKATTGKLPKRLKEALATEQEQYDSEVRDLGDPPPGYLGARPKPAKPKPTGPTSQPPEARAAMHGAEADRAAKARALRMSQIADKVRKGVPLDADEQGFVAGLQQAASGLQRAPQPAPTRAPVDVNQLGTEVGAHIGGPRTAPSAPPEDLGTAIQQFIARRRAGSDLGR